MHEKVIIHKYHSLPVILRQGNPNNMAICLAEDNAATTPTVYFYGKNLLGNNSPWDFDGIVDTMNPY